MYVLFRNCDSRNLNLNPLCMLKAGSVPALWTEKVIKDHIKTFAVLIPGERDLQNVWQLTPLLHLNLVQPDEEKTQGPAACHRVNGKILSCKFFDVFSSFEDDFYNAWEEDIAVVNIFFGKDTVMGEKNTCCISSCGSTVQCPQSWRGAFGLGRWTSSPPWEDFLASVLDSASSRFWRLSTGQSLPFLEMFLTSNLTLIISFKFLFSCPEQLNRWPCH